MTDTTRRQFLKSAVKGAGTTLLTAGIVSSMKPQQRTVKTKVKTVKKVEKLGSKAKAYRSFLQSIGVGHHAKDYKGEAGHRDVSPLTKGKDSTPRMAFEESISKKKTGTGQNIQKLAQQTGGEPSFIRADARQVLADEKNFQRSKAEWEKKNPKKVTKRGIYETIKNKLRTFKPRSGFGGPRPRKVGIGNQDPSRVSGYHY
tara:strand:+ start:72 stop:674 length:603 start_codon:yes stop_codon:yes gene_type:complete